MVKTRYVPQTIEKEKQTIHSSVGKDSLAAPIAAAAAAFVITDVRIGGAASPFAVSLVSALSPSNGLAALLGGLGAAAAAGSIWSCITELAAMTVMLMYSFIFRKRKARPHFTAIISAVAYFLSTCAMNAGNADWVMFIAAFIRSAMCGAMTLCFAEAASVIKKGTISDRKSGFTLTAFSAVFMLFIAALCARSIGILNLGRIAAGFICAAAARKFGTAGGAAAGILSAAAFLLCDQSLARCGAILAFAAMLAGIYMPRGKYAVNIAFICSCFGITAAAGMPSGTPEFIADMGAAAALYCLIPERLYLSRLNGLCTVKKASASEADRLIFASRILEDVGNDVENASEMLRRLTENRRTEEISDIVKSRVCNTLCPQSECSAFGCRSTGILPDSCFASAQSIAERKGFITGKELPACFEGCKRKNQIAEGYNYAFGLRRHETRRDAGIRRLLESASEQLHASCGMISTIADSLGSELKEDTALSESAGKILTAEHFDVRSATVRFDNQMHPFCEAYIDAGSDFSEIYLNTVTEKLGFLLGAELEKPAVLRTEKDRLCRIRWWGDAKYYADCRIAASAAENGICGDSHVTFEDGMGNFWVIIADGMGKGGRAAAQSSMAASLLKRLILTDTGSDNAIKMLNVLINAASSDEVFTTADIFCVNCYTGRAKLIKLGAAPTAVYGKNDDGEYETTFCEQCTLPMGILEKAEISETELVLDESSRVIMMTDGVGSECASYISALMENERLTCEQLADKILACSDEAECEENYRHRDDKTVAAVRLYRTACHIH